MNLPTDHTPTPTTNLECPVCGANESTETMGLETETHHLGWCSNGHVWATDPDHETVEHLIYNFHSGRIDE